jgi:hypothetical protein
VILTFRRAGRLSPASAVTAVIATLIVAAIAVTTLCVVAVVAGGAGCLRGVSRIGGAGRSPARDDRGVVEGVVVRSATISRM